jgi:NitT/TauT family transport system substrate-binding protein
MFVRPYRFYINRALWAAAAVALGVAALHSIAPARADEKITYLFPAPPILPAFGPIQIAKGKGYFSQAGLDVTYAVGRGGVDVAKEVGAGNVPLGGIVADAPIVVRQNGVPVKIVALFGGKGFMQLVVRADSGIQKPADLKGKTITVMSYQDTTFYALLGLLASAGLTQNDVDIQAAGPVGVWQLVASGKSVGMAGVPDWIPPVEAAGVAIKVLPTDEFFPHMAQAIAASDQIIKDKPELVRSFVKAALHGMKDIMDDPDKSAADFVKFVPEWTGKENQVREAFTYYDKLVYPGQKVLGNIEDHAIGIFELALEIAVPLLAEIQEEFAAVGLDAPLRFGEIVDLKAKMVGADIAAWVFQVGGLAAGRTGEIEQGEINHAIAHVNR